METESDRRITRIASDAASLPALIREGAARHGDREFLIGSRKSLARVALLVGDLRKRRVRSHGRVVLDLHHLDAVEPTGKGGDHAFDEAKLGLADPISTHTENSRLSLSRPRLGLDPGCAIQLTRYEGVVDRLPLLISGRRKSISRLNKVGGVPSIIVTE